MNIIERTEEDLKNETVELFNKIKPFLDKGLSFTASIYKVKRSINTNTRWYKDLREYTINQGYQIGRKGK